MLDLHRGTMTIPSDLAKNRKEHRIYLTRVEVSLLTEQSMARAAGTSLIFPTATGKQWTANRFRERVWVAAVEAATLNDKEKDRNAGSVFAGFTFHLLRHTAGSLMALAGIDPAVAAERLGHTDGGALFLKRYRHLYEGEKREQANRLDALVRSALDGEGTRTPEAEPEGLNQADSEDGRYWARTSDPQLVESRP